MTWLAGVDVFWFRRRLVYLMTFIILLLGFPRLQRLGDALLFVLVMDQNLTEFACQPHCWESGSPVQSSLSILVTVRVWKSASLLRTTSCLGSTNSVVYFEMHRAVGSSSDLVGGQFEAQAFIFPCFIEQSSPFSKFYFRYKLAKSLTQLAQDYQTCLTHCCRRCLELPATEHCFNCKIHCSYVQAFSSHATTYSVALHIFGILF